MNLETLSILRNLPHRGRLATFRQLDKALTNGPEKRLVRSHLQTITVLGRSTARPYRLPQSKVLPGKGPKCRGCGQPNSLHRNDPVVRFHHFHMLAKRRRGLKGWTSRSLDKKYADLSTMWRAGRRKFLTKKLALVSDRVINLLGKETVLEYLDQLFPPRKPKPCELRRGWYQFRSGYEHQRAAGALPDLRSVPDLWER